MKIAIMGIGKMGFWLAKELSKENEMAVYDKDSRKAAEVKGAKALASLEEVEKFAPELLINSVSLQHTVKAFEEILLHLPKGCTICDVASVKTGLPEFYKKAGRRFVSLHPMFGPTLADMDSLKEENLVIIKESDAKMAEFFRKFFSSLGLRIFEYSFEEHDSMMAYSLTTPFVTSLVFAACLDKTAVPGTNFSRHMKLARGVLSEDEHLLCEILFNPHSVKQLEKITNRLEFLKHIIKGRDYEEASEFLEKLRQNVK
ncbi:MAG: prephenate dehydrogenase [Candidatus Anstonellaceae archaeon]